VAAPALDEVDERWLRDALPDTELHLFLGRGEGAFVRSPSLVSWLSRTGGSFDVVHVHGLMNPVSTLAMRACVRRGWPLVVRPFGMLSSYTFAHRRSQLKRAYFALLDGPTLARAQALHFTTDTERDEAARHGRGFRERSFVIPPPWVGTASPDGGRRRGARPTALFLSRLHPVKHLELLIGAWRGVTERVPDARLVIAGEGEPAYVRHLRGLAAEAGVGESVSFVGFADGEAKERLLGEADAFVLPSYHENFGVAVLEALAAGVPVVVTREVQLSGFVEAHGLGLVARRGEADLAAGLAHVLTDDTLRARCMTDGRALVERHFSLERVGEALAGMYEEARGKKIF
jgi:glycosyltransferase involved in cell wall biosynthesis